MWVSEGVGCLFLSAYNCQEFWYFSHLFDLGSPPIPLGIVQMELCVLHGVCVCGVCAAVSAEACSLSARQHLYEYSTSVSRARQRRGNWQKERGMKGRREMYGEG